MVEIAMSLSNLPREPVTLQEGGWDRGSINPASQKPTSTVAEWSQVLAKESAEHLSLLQNLPFSSFSLHQWIGKTWSHCFLRLGNHGGLPITQRRKRQTQLCFSISLEKQEVKKIKNRRLSHPRFYFTTSASTKATGLSFHYYNHIM